MNRKLLILSIILLLGIGSFILWQKNNSSIPTQQLDKPQNTNPEGDQLLENSSNNNQSFIEDLRKREYKGGEITIEETISENTEYVSYIFSYPSDDLTIYGRMNVPKGNGPFSVIVLNHGYFNQSSFQSGDGTQTMADILARRGYLTLASDYRGFGKSENDAQGSRGHNPNYTIDILNLIASIKNLPEADTNRIGMWGHSMGGEVLLRTAEATDKVKVIVLWAPTSGRSSDNARFYGGRRPQPTGNPDDGGTSPIDYLRYISSPISLHQGLSDTEVKPEWSKELNDALKKEGKQVEYFEYEGQDHNFKNLGWDLISERTVAFYDKYLK
ncbi:MAG: hypothetical protein A3D74_05595 [Candidatus Levybacteria bacterium RIFCSPHIGHO2_02_FULL_37_13]|nr:MAG: hypothetical protein A3D74_05595 [Candidatus Levybacteria bacterium RIFCSPHIGHO2_02_FULL_37_13]OGH29114.1 MAG: hypothetical protein A3E40_03135 [Candidatus Levybacteria bacterium RIFCSPHIGHO2_12_FULL_37_9]OGH40418.1 MAG: hypothetical protein A3B41_02820 [Candidatus Levybacteria bacterium RIFCSPLOWO2_01_FULL_37_26]